MKFIGYIIKLACNVAEGISKGGDFFGFEGCDPAIHRLSRKLLGEPGAGLMEIVVGDIGHIS